MTQSDVKPAVPEDLAGESYISVIARLHEALSPTTYLEIGVDKGDTLSLSKCHTIGIDPSFRFRDPLSFSQRTMHLFQMTSDDFFANYSPTAVFGSAIDMAFLDGMHRCEFLLRDFANTERHCKRNSVVMLHDCLPVEPAMTTRQEGGGRSRMLAPHREGWWTGDVWRTALIIKRRRPDIRLTALDASGTGLLLLTNLDPSNTLFNDDYANCVEAMLSWDLEALGTDQYFEEIGKVSTSTLDCHEAITSKFWL